MDFTTIFPFNPNYDSYNCDMEILIREDEERMKFNQDYKLRFIDKKDGKRKYTAIIKKEHV